MSRGRRLVAPLVSLAAVAGLAACDSSGAPPTAHNAADVGFAQGMIPHHAQAVEMADQALAKATTQRVRRLATGIEAAQAPEIATMSEWLRSWGERVPATTGSMDDQMSGGSGHMAGMMSSDQMDRLDRVTGAAFDRLWTRLMIAHHEGAIASARTEVSHGEDPRAVRLALGIQTSQQAEVTMMRSWLSRS